MVVALSCRKDEDYPDTMMCEIIGQVQVRDLNIPAYIDPQNRPTVVLLERYYHKPWSTSMITMLKTVVDSNGWYMFTAELTKGGEYCLDIGSHDTSRYLNMVNPWLEYKPKQTVHYPLVAISWAIPRFINDKNLPDDTFKYITGIGNAPFIYPILIGPADTIMPWIYRTWGGTKVAQLDHYASGFLTRNGIERDTKIYYSVPPGDTSIIEIRY